MHGFVRVLPLRSLRAAIGPRLSAWWAPEGSWRRASTADAGKPPERCHEASRGVPGRLETPAPGRPRDASRDATWLRSPLFWCSIFVFLLWPGPPAVGLLLACPAFVLVWSSPRPLSPHTHLHSSSLLHSRPAHPFHLSTPHLFSTPVLLTPSTSPLLIPSPLPSCSPLPPLHSSSLLHSRPAHPFHLSSSRARPPPSLIPLAVSSSSILPSPCSLPTPGGPTARPRVTRSPAGRDGERAPASDPAPADVREGPRGRAGMSAAASAARTSLAGRPRRVPTDLIRAGLTDPLAPGRAFCRPAPGGGQLCWIAYAVPDGGIWRPVVPVNARHSSGRLDPTVACRFGADGIGRDRAFCAPTAEQAALIAADPDQQPMPTATPTPAATPMAAARHGDRERDERRRAAPLRGRRRHVGGCCARRRRPRRWLRRWTRSSRKAVLAPPPTAEVTGRAGDYRPFPGRSVCAIRVDIRHCPEPSNTALASASGGYFGSVRGTLPPASAARQVMAMPAQRAWSATLITR